MGTKNTNYFPGFDYEASQLSAFLLSLDVFIIALKDGGTTNFIPKDIEDFRKWLLNHNVRDIKKDDGTKNNKSARQ